MDTIRPISAVRHFLFFLIFCFTFSSPVSAKNWFEKILDGAGEVIAGGDEESEIKLGKQVDADIAKEHGFVNDPVQQRRVNAIGQSMAKIGSRKDLKWHFKVIDSDEINAFAAPGGYIYVTKGLLGLVKSDHELAGVLGHEITHVNKKHVMKAMGQAGLISAGIGLILGGGKEGKNDKWIKLGGSLGGSFLGLHMSREHEFEADQGGLELTSKAGYNPNGLRMFLVKLQEKHGGKVGNKTLENIQKWLSTHPETGDRIKKAEAWIKANGHKVEEIPDGTRVNIPENKEPEKKKDPDKKDKFRSLNRVAYISRFKAIVRVGASDSSKALGRLSRNKKVQIIGVMGNWYQVKIGKTKGWIYKSDLAASPVSNQNAQTTPPPIQSSGSMAAKRVQKAKEKLATLENLWKNRTSGFFGWFRKKFGMFRSEGDKKLLKEIEFAKEELDNAQLNLEFERKTQLTASAVNSAASGLGAGIIPGNIEIKLPALKESALDIKIKAIKPVQKPPKKQATGGSHTELQKLYNRLQQAKKAYLTAARNPGLSSQQKKKFFNDYAVLKKRFDALNR
ncbi:M48 family metalloprotease [Candidatus Riflebacteria bacterium]